MATTKRKSRILEEMHETARGLHEAGLISKRRMREFDALRHLDVEDMPPQKIKSLREKAHVSQAVFAAVLNTSLSTVQKWETGDKKPSGPSLKLLNLIEREGLEAVLGPNAMDKTLVVGVLPQEKVRARMFGIARGKHKPKPGEPKVWFTSMKSLAEVLSDENRALLRVITETKPDSIAALAETTGRKPSNLSRTLKTMSNYGIVEMRREKRHVRPIAKATEFRIVAS